ncbi:MAG: aldehyde dehydrogenase [Candidatus Omnitrophota bacterium]
MAKEEFFDIANVQRKFFLTCVTKDISFRVRQLEILRKTIIENEKEILDALRSDLGKPEMEAYVAEVSDVINDIDIAVKNIRRWAKPLKTPTPLMLFPAKSYIYAEPYGSVLIIAPWNYPFKLAMSPLVGAMAAGNCVVVKPSEYAPHTARVIVDIITRCFESRYIKAIEGGVEEARMLLEQKFDYIFFTGGTAIGKIVAMAAATNLTPVTLELGGKSPCIVDEDIDIEKTAKRICWGKFFNAGQSCISPDYLIAHKSVKQKLIQAMIKCIEKFYGKDPFTSPDYARIVNEKHFLRVSELLKEGNIVCGGETNAEKLYIAPTIVDNIPPDAKITREEIFGPVLPVMEYDNLDEVIADINKGAKPLALYFFSRNKEKQDKILKETSAGDVNINDTMAHIQNKHLPFGGVGDSGIGKYQGKWSFDTFSHKKSVVKRAFFIDPAMKYPPYKIPLAMIKKLMKFMG